MLFPSYLPHLFRHPPIWCFADAPPFRLQGSFPLSRPGGCLQGPLVGVHGTDPDPVFPAEGIGGLLIGALERSGHPLPPVWTLPTLLDTRLLGLCPMPHTAHGTLALHQRLTQDCTLLTGLWRDLGTEPRPIVPVFV